MVLLCKEEADTHLLKKLHTFLRSLVNVYTQCFQTVCCSAEGGSCSVSVLGNLHTACCDHKGRGCGNIEAVCIITTGSYDLQHIHIVLNL